MARGFGVSTASVDLGRLADDVARLPREFLILAAKRAKAIVNEEGRALVGADGMRGKKKRGLKATARDTIKDQRDQSTVRVQGSVPAWVWLNTGTAPHMVRRRKRGKKRKLLVGPISMPARGAWDGRVVPRIEREIPPIFDRALDEVVGRG